MNKNNPNVSENDEVDLSKITSGFSNLVSSLKTRFFNLILFFKKKLLIIASLLIIGFGIGLYLDKNIVSYNHELIVTPNFGANDYLYSKIEKLNSKILQKDTLDLSKLGFKNISKIGKLTLEPVIDIYKFINNNEDNFELIKLMAEDGDLEKIVENKITSKNYPFHVLKFGTSNKVTDEGLVIPLMSYLNESEYFEKLKSAYRKNVEIKMRENDSVIKQIDVILNAFKTSSSVNPRSSSLVYYNENTELNEIIKTKELLIAEQGSLRIDVINTDQIIKNIVVSTNLKNMESINGKLKLVLPLLFISIYLFIYLFKEFYNSELEKSKQI